LLFRAPDARALDLVAMNQLINYYRITLYIYKKGKEEGEVCGGTSFLLHGVPFASENKCQFVALALAVSQLPESHFHSEHIFHDEQNRRRPCTPHTRRPFPSQLSPKPPPPHIVHRSRISRCNFFIY